MLLVSVEQMRALENEARKKGISNQQLMENAGSGIAEKILDIAHRQNISLSSIIGIVGNGNNGGDTLIALTKLAQKSIKSIAVINERAGTNEPLVNLFVEAGGIVIEFRNDPKLLKFSEFLAKSEILLDGVFGTGFKLPIRVEVSRFLDQVKEILSVSRKPPMIIAIDCPSGIDNDSGEVSEGCIKASHTICIATIKRGLVKLPANEYCGEIHSIEIGLNSKNSSINELKNWVATPELVKSYMIKRPRNAHKGTFGTALIVAGSINYTGAVLLAGKAAYKVGAGLVTLGIPSSLYSALAGQFPEGTWLLLPNEMGMLNSQAAGIARNSFEKATAVLIGCGIGLEDSTFEFMRTLLSENPRTPRKGTRIGFTQSGQMDSGAIAPKVPPMVIDADGLKQLSKIAGWQKLLPQNSVLTPHPGEMQILTGVAKEKIQENRLSVAIHFAKEWKQIVVLKGAFTVIASPDGKTATIPIATPALAKAGSGDVLAGMIVGLMAQGVNNYNAAVAGAWIHANAGLICEKEFGGTTSVMAGDILDAINNAIGLFGN